MIGQNKNFDYLCFQHVLGSKKSFKTQVQHTSSSRPLTWIPAHIHIPSTPIFMTSLISRFVVLIPNQTVYSPKTGTILPFLFIYYDQPFLPLSYSICNIKAVGKFACMFCKQLMLMAISVRDQSAQSETCACCLVYQLVSAEHVVVECMWTAKFHA